MANSFISETELLHPKDQETCSPDTEPMANMTDNLADTENFVYGEQGLDEKADDSVTMNSKVSKEKGKKTCGVCGDRALGYNFNAVTCESCKAFFRRNAFKISQIHCLFKNNCVVDLRTRRFCPACRMKKCFEIGMKREMILDDKERKARMAKVLHNRAKKQPVSTDTSVKTEPLDSSRIHEESSNSSPLFSESLQSPFGTPPENNDSFDKRFQPVSSDDLPSDPAMYRTLTEGERLLLNDIAVCYETTLAAMPDMNLSQESYQNANDLVNHSEVSVRQLIKFVKRLDDFRNLRQEDQITALKGSVMKSLLLRSVAFYIVEKDAWLTQKGEIPCDILSKATGFTSLHNLHVSYCRTLKAIILNNFSLYALMQVLLLFLPDGLNLVNRELMSNLHDKYIKLLKHYLEAEFSFSFAQQYMVAILDKMLELNVLSDHHSRILLQVNPNQVEPLMLEVLNLK